MKDCHKSGKLWTLSSPSIITAPAVRDRAMRIVAIVFPDFSLRLETIDTSALSQTPSLSRTA